MGNSHSGVFEQKTDLDGLRVTIVPALLHGYAELSSTTDNDDEAQHVFNDLKQRRPQEVRHGCCCHRDCCCHQANGTMAAVAIP